MFQEADAAKATPTVLGWADAPSFWMTVVKETR
jgi:hypothetical protein